MDDREHMELMWENGRVLMRGLASSRSCTSYTPLPNKNVNEVKNNSDGYSTKRPWLGTGNNSILGDFPLIDDREPRDKYPQDDHHPELLSELCETSFNMFLENNENNNFEKNITDARVVPEYRNANWRPGNAFEFAAEVPQLSTASNGQLYQSFLEQQKASVPSFHGLPGSKLQQVDSEPDNRSRLQNYPPILRPAHRKPNQGSIAARSTSGTPGSSSRLWQLKSSTDEPPADLVESGQMVPTYASKVLKYFHDEQNLLASQIVPIAPIARPPEASPPDEQSEAGFHNYATTSKRCCDLVVGSTSGGGAEKTTKGKPDRGKSIDQLAATTSICSRGASNDPTPSSLERQYEDTEGTAYTSDDLEEEEQVPARGSAGSKRKRAAKIHILSERKRRDKINKKMRALQDLIPNSNKVDKASMLDEAIDYLKSLQLQVQIMSMATRPCMPAMMLPAAMQHMMIHAPLLAQFSAMGAAMDTRLMQMGAGCSPATFPASAMFGLPPGQMLPMSVSRAPPFFPLNIGGHSTHSSAPLPAMSGVAGAPNLEFLRSAVVFPSSKDMIYSNTSARK